VPSHAIDELKQNALIESLTFGGGVGTLQIFESVPAFGAPSFWAGGNTGSGQTVAILDSGATPSHPAFGGRVRSLETVNFNSAGCNLGDNANTPLDILGHGTHVAGIITSQGVSGPYSNFFGVAPGLSALISVKVTCATNSPFQILSQADII